jgi:hypothetical protein
MIETDRRPIRPDAKVTNIAPWHREHRVRRKGVPTLGQNAAPRDDFRVAKGEEEVVHYGVRCATIVVV